MEVFSMKIKINEKLIATSLITATLGLAGLNALLRLFNTIIPMMDALIAVLVFFSVFVMVYTINKFKFKTLMNLLFFVGFILVLVLILVYAGELINTSPPFVQAIYNGFLPLVYGIIPAGIVSGLVGFVRLDKIGGRK